MALTDNPMSLVVTGNVTVGATLEASVPTTETRLLSTIDVYHEHEGEVALDVYSVNGKKYWLSLWDHESAYDIWYVGVTPNKSYTLKLSTDSETGTESGSVTISYSQSINNQTPKVTDY